MCQCVCVALGGAPGRCGRLISAAGTVLLLAGAAAGQPQFVRETVDSQNTGDCKAVADFNGDGKADIAMGGVSPLAWYRSPTWERRVIATPADQFTTDMQAADVDGDGDPDIVVPDGSSGAIAWFENPRPGGDPFTAPWPRHPIGSHGTYAHDIEVGPFGAAGRLGVVSRGGGIAKLWYQTAPNVWAVTTIAVRAGEGVGLGDIDGDGDLDVAIGAVWLENPGAGWGVRGSSGR